MTKRFGWAACAAASLALAGVAVAQEKTGDDAWRRFSGLDVWEDGLSEMCYYAATEEIYGRERKYTRVHLLNRQWMSGETGVKEGPSDPSAVSVFKLNIAEEIPTENYNYRYLTTVFLRRPDLRPFKLVTSSQEWCGTTFKHLRWGREGAQVQSFSYFPMEGDRDWQVSADALPHEALFVLVRACVASGSARDLQLLTAVRGTHEVKPEAHAVKLELGDDPRVLRVPAGRFSAQRVEVVGPTAVSGSFDVESTAPFRLLAFKTGGTAARLEFSERRPYWDRSSRSGFHKPNRAP